MNIIKAKNSDFSTVKYITHMTIKIIYPHYYPKDVVEFFLKHHSDENIHKAIEREIVLLLEIGGLFVGTGSVKENEIVRVFVLPQFQGKGYGSLLMDELENRIDKEYSEIVLDSSLPAYNIYKKLGYKSFKYEKITTSNKDVLCYYSMKKYIKRDNIGIINYDNKFFSSICNTSNGEVSSSTIFKYHQSGDIIWAEYSGGDIIKGFLIGTSDCKSN